jgi:hypothetical protein
MIASIILALLLAIFLPQVMDAQMQSAYQTAVTLYDGALNTGTPDTQGFLYLTYPLFSAQATQTFTNPVTTLDTTPQRTDDAGYFAKSGLYAPLDRGRGYQVQFTAQVVTESHVSNDRAGFSLLVMSSDTHGIELGFWENEVWAQEGGTAQPFTHAESASFATTSGLIDYRLSVLGNTYALAADGVTILTGLLRDYTAAPPPVPFNPYNTANLLFLGDDTSSAQATLKLAAVLVVDGPPFSVYLPLIRAAATVTRH